jgi:hypothetical protein
MILSTLRKVFEPIAIFMIIVGIIGLIQPLKIGLYRWGFNVLWVGLVVYILFSHFPSK